MLAKNISETLRFGLRAKPHHIAFAKFLFSPEESTTIFFRFPPLPQNGEFVVCAGDAASCFKKNKERLSVPYYGRLIRKNNQVYFQMFKTLANKRPFLEYIRDAKRRHFITIESYQRTCFSHFINTPSSILSERCEFPPLPADGTCNFFNSIRYPSDLSALKNLIGEKSFWGELAKDNKKIVFRAYASREDQVPLMEYVKAPKTKKFLTLDNYQKKVFGQFLKVSSLKRSERCKFLPLPEDGKYNIFFNVHYPTNLSALRKLSGNNFFWGELTREDQLIIFKAYATPTAQEPLLEYYIRQALGVRLKLP